MKQRGLMLPHKCQTLGWILAAIPFVVLGIMLMTHIFCNESQIIQLDQKFSPIFVSAIYLCIPIGGAILCLSKEKEEDEMIRSIRLKTIGIMALVELLICVVFFCFYGLRPHLGIKPPSPYIAFLGHSIFCFQFPVYFCLFKLLLFINKKRNEE